MGKQKNKQQVAQTGNENQQVQEKFKKPLSEASDSEFKDYENSLIYVLTKKYDSFKIRLSYLDSSTDKSIVNRSLFVGFYNVAMIFGCITLITYPTLQFSKTGQWISQDLFNTFRHEFLLVLITWPLFYIWSHTAFILQKMIIYGLPVKIVPFLQHITQTLMFIYTIYMVVTRNWCTTHSGFISMQACVMFMKMHSYTIMNRDYRENYIESSKDPDIKPLSIYPQNVNFKDFTLFMWMPVLVYETSYPRWPEKRRPFYIFVKSIATIFAILMAYILMSDFVIPQIERGYDITGVELIIRLCLPMCIFWLLIFFIIWELILNIFAEITRFGDRQFYQDWWNSTTYEEFNRKWNRPVYNFLFRHVYLECIYRYKKSKKFAQMCTFLFSAFLHEWVISLVLKVVMPIFMGFMMQQIPLFYITRSMQGKRSGSFLFWWGMIFGIPLIGTLYLKQDNLVLNYSKQMNHLDINQTLQL